MATRRSSPPAQLAFLSRAQVLTDGPEATGQTNTFPPRASIARRGAAIVRESTRRELEQGQYGFPSPCFIAIQPEGNRYVSLRKALDEIFPKPPFAVVVQFPPGCGAIRIKKNANTPVPTPAPPRYSMYLFFKANRRPSVRIFGSRPVPG